MHMKHKLSITVDKEVIVEIQRLIREDIFRNKSHVMEFAVKKLLKERSK